MTIEIQELKSGGSSKYEAIAASIGDEIANGRLKPGEKLPTQRELAKRLLVTIGTVGRAYALAEKRGLITLEVGRGSFVRSFESRSAGFGHADGTIDLGLNLPSATEQDTLLAKTLAQMSNSRDVGRLFGPTPVESFEHHRQAAAKWLSQRFACSSGNVLITGGTQNALLAVLASLAKPGDSILVESLTFPGLLAVAKLLKLELIPVATDEHGMVPDNLDRAARKAKLVYCIPTNQNPTTVTMPLRRRRAIAKVAAKRNLTIVDDDAYGHLVDDSPAPIASNAPDRTILISSLSKSMSVGLRLAYMYVPAACRAAIIANLRASSFFASPLLCEIATSWVNSEIAAQLLNEQRATARRRQLIANEVFGDRAYSHSPEGNHIWMHLPDSWSAETLERAAKENGVLIYPASAFAASNQSHPNAIRIALGAARNDSELKIGLTLIERLLKNKSETLTAKY